MSPDRVREALKDFRPEGDLVLDEPLCRPFITDDGGITIGWRGDGRDAHLSFNFGCDWAAHEKMARSLQAAPGLLGVDPLRPVVFVSSSNFPANLRRAADAAA